jgi:hypothetical protein
MPEPSKLIDQLLGKRFAVPELGDMVQAIMSEFGGFQVFAKEWMASYTKCTGVARANMLRDFTRLMVMANEQAQSNPVEGMSTEEIEHTVKELLKGFVDGER